MGRGTSAARRAASAAQTRTVRARRRTGLSRAHMRALFDGFSHNGLTAVAEQVTGHDQGFGLECRGSVVRDGRRVGEFSRFQRVEGRDRDMLVFKNAYLNLDPSVHGLGFGRAFHDHCEQQYRDVGAQRVEIWATRAGTYAWADCGYEFLSEDHPLRRHQPDWLPASEATAILRAARDNLLRLVADRHVAERDLDAFRGRFMFGRDSRRWYDVDADERDRAAVGMIRTPGEIAAWGRDRPWEGEDGRTTWLGRECLLAYGRIGWRGVKWLSA
jgi:GNAT superfamily N-acetyltransferase